MAQLQGVDAAAEIKVQQTAGGAGEPAKVSRKSMADELVAALQAALDKPVTVVRRGGEALKAAYEDGKAEGIKIGSGQAADADTGQSVLHIIEAFKRQVAELREQNTAQAAQLVAGGASASPEAAAAQEAATAALKTQLQEAREAERAAGERAAQELINVQTAQRLQQEAAAQHASEKGLLVSKLSVASTEGDTARQVAEAAQQENASLKAALVAANAKIAFLVTLATAPKAAGAESVATGVEAALLTTAVEAGVAISGAAATGAEAASPVSMDAALAAALAQFDSQTNSTWQEEAKRSAAMVAELTAELAVEKAANLAGRDRTASVSAFTGLDSAEAAVVDPASLVQADLVARLAAEEARSEGLRTEIAALRQQQTQATGASEGAAIADPTVAGLMAEIKSLQAQVTEQQEIIDGPLEQILRLFPLLQQRLARLESGEDVSVEEQGATAPVPVTTPFGAMKVALGLDSGIIEDAKRIAAEERAKAGAGAETGAGDTSVRILDAAFVASAAAPANEAGLASSVASDAPAGSAVASSRVTFADAVTPARGRRDAAGSAAASASKPGSLAEKLAKFGGSARRPAAGAGATPAAPAREAISPAKADASWRQSLRGDGATASRASSAAAVLRSPQGTAAGAGEQPAGTSAATPARGRI